MAGLQKGGSLTVETALGAPGKSQYISTCDRQSAGVIAGTANAAPDAWRRFAAYMIQAFSATTASRSHRRRPPPRCTGPCCTGPRPVPTTSAAAADHTGCR